MDPTDVTALYGHYRTGFVEPDAVLALIARDTDEVGRLLRSLSVIELDRFATTLDDLARAVRETRDARVDERR